MQDVYLDERGPAGGGLEQDRAESPHRARRASCSPKAGASVVLEVSDRTQAALWAQHNGLGERGA